MLQRSCGPPRAGYLHGVLWGLFILESCCTLVKANSLVGLDRKDSGEEDEDDDDGIDLEPEAIIGIVIGAIALIVAVPTLICFCLGCACFRPKKEKIIAASSSAPTLAVDGKRFSEAEYADGKLNNRRDSQISSTTFPSAPDVIMDPRSDAFYYNLGFEPPPPYYGHGLNYSEDPWSNNPSRAGSARPSQSNIYEAGDMKVGPSAIKGQIA